MYDLKLGKRDDYHHAAQNRIEHAIEAELFRGDGKLTVDRQDQQRIKFSGSDQLRDVRDIHEEERLEQLRDHLMRAKKQDDFPFRPVTDSVHLAEDDAEEDDLAAKPEHFHDHPENEIRFETQLANERVAQHDPPNLKIAAHPSHRFHSFPLMETPRHRTAVLRATSLIPVTERRTHRKSLATFSALLVQAGVRARWFHLSPAPEKLNHEEKAEGHERGSLHPRDLDALLYRSDRFRAEAIVRR